MRSLIAVLLIIATGSAAASADLFIYPNMGQDPEQQRKRRLPVADSRQTLPGARNGRNNSEMPPMTAAKIFPAECGEIRLM